MINRTLILLLCLLAPTTIWGGEDINDNIYCANQEWHTAVSTHLPNWMTEELPEDEVISMSDPKLKEDVAREQALIRAVLLHLMQQRFKFNMLSDYFVSNQTKTYGNETNDSQKDKVLCLASIELSKKKIACAVRKSFRSPFHETYLRVCVGARAEKMTDVQYISTSAIMELMMTTTSRKFQREMVDVRYQMSQEVNGLPVIHQNQWLAKGKLSRLRHLSVINETEVCNSQHDMWYKNTTSSSISDKCEGYALNRGLWSAYFISIANALITKSYDKSVTSETTETFNGKYRNLNRHLYTINLLCKPQILGVAKNKLYVSCSISEKQ